jgi:hypothetical protein
MTLTRMTRRARWWIAGILLSLALPAAAHERSTSYSAWDIRSRSARVTARLTLLDASRFPWFAGAGAEATLRRYVPEKIQLLVDDRPCPPAGPAQALSSEPGRLVYEWSVTCPASGSLAIRSDLLLEVAPSHLHFARVTRDGASLGERVLSEAERVWSLPAPSASGGEGTGTTILGYVGLGIEHILTGYDHLAFLLALLLVETALVEVAKVVTGFTIGHSITLALAALGYVEPEAHAIEALIGLSIALVAVEDLWLMGGAAGFLPWCVAVTLAALAVAALGGYGIVSGLTLGGLALFSLCYFALLRTVKAPARMRWAVALLFGLVHGFGFASILAEAHLPPERLVQALFGFNLGVEIGQIGCVVLAWPIIALATRSRSRVGWTVVQLSVASVLALGVFWFTTRAYG